MHTFFKEKVALCLNNACFSTLSILERKILIILYSCCTLFEFFQKPKQFFGYLNDSNLKTKIV
jgi:hypothetical protein